MGEACPAPVSFVLKMTSRAAHLRGMSFVSETPVPLGSRNRDQSAAMSRKMGKTRATRKSRVRTVFLLVMRGSAHDGEHYTAPEDGEEAGSEKRRRVNGIRPSPAFRVFT